MPASGAPDEQVVVFYQTTALQDTKIYRKAGYENDLVMSQMNLNLMTIQQKNHGNKNTS